MEENLWPENLIGDISIPTPAAILRSQARQLEVITKRTLIGKVLTLPTENHGELYYRLTIVCPYLDNYEYYVFGCWQNIADQFPIWTAKREDLAYSEEEFKQLLARKFAAPETMQAIKTLYANSIDFADEKIFDENVEIPDAIN